MNGGYIMLDCTGLDLIKGETPQSINGLYRNVSMAMNTHKPLFAYNCNWGGIDVSPIQTFAIQIAPDTIICTSSTLQIVIKNTDVVTINNMVG